ncbi:type IV secretion system protein [Alteriqipengyuania flavescens]|uniref:type IV secretion system protein n=1 Tax=Alteriqipengyuania flavescens TaxID=3053610 RepID=UPI0025B39A96|nr:type IV secretion system protein [Alteriqipengyuania flavescens]WJY17829.1 type IV secretion system protein [Alteriqipengyuania flavescens]WJY23770.1 type IV secretion system protein [Alteriqipengyuania flavescens]
MTVVAAAPATAQVTAQAATTAAGQCQQAAAQVGGSISGSLAGIDCVTQEMTQSAFFNIFASGGAMAPILTLVLTLFIAIFGFLLLTGRSRLGIAELTPRMMTLGFIVTLVTSWVAFQTLVWDVAGGGPDWIATQLMGSDQSATLVFAQKIDIVFASVAEVAGGDGAEVPSSVFSPSGLMWFGATLFLLGTVGVLVTARIALAVLVALGPIFLVMALFRGTHGMFVGWLRGVMMLALTPLFAVIGGSLMLELSIPVINALRATPGEIDPRAAMAFFMVGAVHCALMVMGVKVAGTMVAGWNIFGLAAPRDIDRGINTAATAAANAPITVNPAAVTGPANSTAAAAMGPGGSRRIDVSAGALAPVANDSAGAAGGGGNRTTRIYATGPGESPQAGSAAVSRARGIGSRFKSAPVGRPAARASEKR